MCEITHSYKTKLHSSSKTIQKLNILLTFCRYIASYFYELKLKPKYQPMLQLNENTKSNFKFTIFHNNCVQFKPYAPFFCQIWFFTIKKIENIQSEYQTVFVESQSHPVNIFSTLSCYFTNILQNGCLYLIWYWQGGFFLHTHTI